MAVPWGWRKNQLKSHARQHTDKVHHRQVHWRSRLTPYLVGKLTNRDLMDFSLPAHLAACQWRLRQAGDDLDILPHALDIYPTAPALALQTGADKRPIRLGEPARDVFMVRVAAQEHGEMG